MIKESIKEIQNLIQCIYHKWVNNLCAWKTLNKLIIINFQSLHQLKHQVYYKVKQKILNKLIIINFQSLQQLEHQQSYKVKYQKYQILIKHHTGTNVRLISTEDHLKKFKDKGFVM